MTIKIQSAEQKHGCPESLGQNAFLFRNALEKKKEMLWTKLFFIYYFLIKSQQEAIKFTLNVL